VLKGGKEKLKQDCYGFFAKQGKKEGLMTARGSERDVEQKKNGDQMAAVWTKMNDATRSS